MRDDESLTPASRLNSDSATSPTWAAAATTAPTVTSWKTLSCKPRRLSTSGPYSNAAMRPPTTPPTAPAHVLCGDRTGVSFGPPIRVPAAMAHVSHTHVTTSGSSASATEPRERGGEDPAPQPQHRHRDRNGRNRDGDADQQVAGHQGGAVTLPNRRSRRW